MPDRWVLIHHASAVSRWTWSGIPHGLAQALGRTVTATRISADLPFPGEAVGRRLARRLGVAYGLESAARPLVEARDLRLRALADLRESDVAILLASSTFGYRLGRARPRVLATFQDGTVLQSRIPKSPGKLRWQARERELYAAADICFVASPWAADAMVRHYDVPKSKICVTGFGFNVGCRPTEKDFSKPRILWTGLDWERKGGDLLVEAFERAAIPGARLDLVGAHPQIDRPGIVGHGVIRDEARMRELFEAATLFALPTRFDAFGIVFLEAASAGTPTLGTEVGGVPFAVGPGGETVAPDDLDALVRGLVRMTDPARAASYATRAAAHAADHDWTSVAGRMLAAVAAIGA